MSFVEQCLAKYGSKYDYGKTVFTDEKTLVTIVCKIHGPFKRMPLAHLRGTGCSFCKVSKGELEIRSVLQACKSDFIDQFDPRAQQEAKTKMKDNRYFDFFINIPQLKKKCLVEFDGEPHFKFVKFFHKTPEKFALAQQADIDKTRWAVENDYYIIRIDYTCLGRIATILMTAIQSTERVWFSNPAMYKYISDGLIKAATEVSSRVSS